MQLSPSYKIQDQLINSSDDIYYHLTIQLGLEQLTACLLDTKRFKYLGLVSYVFKKKYDYDSLISVLKEILNEDDLLKHKFHTVTVLFVSQTSTIIPSPLYDEDKKDTYLKFNHNVDFEKEIVLADKLNTLDALNIYSIPVNIKMFLNESFSEPKIRHYKSSLIENLLVSHKNDISNKKVIVHIQPAHFDMIILKGKELIFNNSFKYITAEDLIYYILFVFEQFKMSPEVSPVIIIGELDKKSKIYNLMYKYIRNITFETRNESFNYSYLFNDIPSYFFYNVLNHYLCE